MKISTMHERLAKGENPLDLSIEKWQDIVNGTGEDEGRLNCALCAVYEKNCPDCPSFSCMDSPYGDYVMTYKNQESKRKRLAEKELKFLKKLKEKLSVMPKTTEENTT